MNYSEIIPVLVKGMQDQQQIIQTQQQTLEDLRQQIQSLKELINAGNKK
jgi:hypothetical protein